MKADQLLRAILPNVLIDNFEVVGFEKSNTRFNIWLGEKKVQPVKANEINYAFENRVLRMHIGRVRL